MINQVRITTGIIICLLGGSFASIAQHAGGKAEKFAATIKVADLKNNLSIIAGAAMEGRETGTAGQARAADFIANVYKQIGLSPGNNGSYFQCYPLIKDSVIRSSLQVNGREFAYGTDYTLLPAIDHDETLDAGPERPMELVWGGYGIVDASYNNLANIHVKGKALLVLNGEPKNDSGYLFTHSDHISAWSSFSIGGKRRAQAAAKMGATALFIVDTGATWKTKFFSPIRLEPDARDSIGINTYIISGALARSIVGDRYDSLIAGVNRERPADFQTHIPLHASQTITHERISASNVMAFLPGTDKKEELLVISAHYDHLGVRKGSIYYGADDNGSGTTAVLAMAKAFVAAKAAGVGPRRSILFLNVSGEEEGLWGSAYYTTNPVYPLSHTIADLNTDMIGRIDPGHQRDSNYLYIIGDNKLSSALRPINEANNNAYTRLHLDYKYNNPDDPERIYYRSDHYNFAKNKIPIIFFFDGINVDYHKPTDTPDKINYDLMLSRLKLVFYDAWSLANQNEPPPVDRNEK